MYSTYGNSSYPMMTNNSNAVSPYYSYNNTNSSNDDRFVGGFLGPFVLGGITGGLLAPAFYPRPYYNPYPYPYYGPYYR